MSRDTFVALLRGINIIGNNKLPMAALKVVFEQHGCVSVRTYIQSGNVVFQHSASKTANLAKRVAAAISKNHGFEPRVLVLMRRELEQAVAGNPFPQAADNPTSVHIFFLDQTPAKPDLKSMEAIRAKTEAFALKGKFFYLHTPDGFGRSKLASRAERLLGVDATARNWRTVTTLLEIVSGPNLEHDESLPPRGRKG